MTRHAVGVAVLAMGLIGWAWASPLAAQGTWSGLRACDGTPHTELADNCASADCQTAFCAPPERFWVRADYLMWWLSGVQLPPLVTGSPPNTPQSQAGVLGEPGTTILFGDSPAGDRMRSGIRVRMGVALGGCRGWALEGDYFTVGQQSAGYDSGPRADTPIISRPFFDLLPRDDAGQPIPGAAPRYAAELVSYPGILIGKVIVEYRDTFQSAGIWGRHPLCCWDADPCADPCGRREQRVDLIVGYRWYSLTDSITIHEDLISGPQGALPGTAFLITDSFRARNEFHGAELGFVATTHRGRWSLEVLAKVALGNQHQTVVIDGSTSITPPAQSTEVFGEGIYAGRTNVGTYERDRFVMIPQLGVEIGYQWTERLRTFLGYSILYWPEVMRSPDQIDQNLDTGNFPPTVDPSLPYPTFPAISSGLWAQGINLGAELRF